LASLGEGIGCETSRVRVGSLAHSAVLKIRLWEWGAEQRRRLFQLIRLAGLAECTLAKDRFLWKAENLS
jgi:hypothetical protein